MMESHSLMKLLVNLSLLLAVAYGIVALFHPFEFTLPHIAGSPVVTFAVFVLGILGLLKLDLG